MSERNIDTRIREALRKADDLPSLPSVAAEVLRLTQNEEFTLDELVQVVALDPALTSKLLRMANSPLFSPGGRISTLQRATMVLGTKTVKLMSLGFSLVAALPHQEKGPFDLREFWRRSVICAAAGRTVANVTKSVLADEAFLCGLLSRIGQLVLARYLADDYAKVLVRTEGRWPGTALERKVLGYDASEVAAAVLGAWDFPPLLCLGVMCAPDPQRLPKDAPPGAKELVRILHVATACEELLCGSEASAAMERLLELAERSFNLSSEGVDALLTELEPSINECAAMLEIETQGVQMDDILRRAQEELVKEVLGVTLEMREVRQHAQALESENRELSDRAYTDGLTELPNRACFEETMTRVVQDLRSKRLRGAVGILMIDVDHFKTFNDSYGHKAGDEVLRMVGRVIREVTRADDLAARYGGEEFVVILKRATFRGLKALAERIRSSVEAQRLDVPGGQISVTVSVGGAVSAQLESLQALRELVEAADRLLYQAKQGGRNRCCFWPRPAAVQQDGEPPRGLEPDPIKGPGG